MYLTSSFVFKSAAQAAARFSGADEGNVYVPEPKLLQSAVELLEVGPELLPPALDRLEAARRIQRERLPGATEPAVEDNCGSATAWMESTTTNAGCMCSRKVSTI